MYKHTIGEWTIVQIRKHFCGNNSVKVAHNYTKVDKVVHREVPTWAEKK